MKCKKSAVALMLAALCLLSACGVREQLPDQTDEPVPSQAGNASRKEDQPAMDSPEDPPVLPADDVPVDPDNPDMEGIVDAVDGSTLQVIPGERIELEGGFIAGAQPFGDDAERVQVELAADVVIQVRRIHAAGEDSTIEAGSMADLQPGCSVNLWGADTAEGFMAKVVTIIQMV